MIIDLCKPINEGEDGTVKIVMSIHEARRLVDLRTDEGTEAWRKDVIDALHQGIRRAVGSAEEA